MRSIYQLSSIYNYFVKAVKAEVEIEKPEYIELCHSHEAYGVKTRVNLVWTTLEEIKKVNFMI